MAQLLKGISVSGDTTIVLIGPADRFAQLEPYFSKSATGAIWKFFEDDPRPEEIGALADQLEREIERAGLRRVNLVATSWGGPIAIQYAASYPRNVRRMVLVDAKARLRQSAVERIVEWCEEYLPLGLPFRPLSRAFDPRPLLHRVRCPTLILHSPELLHDAEFLIARVPNAWREELILSSLTDRFEQFLEVSTKQPQKRLSRA